MVTGIDSFKEWFKGSEEQYAIIGGTACDILMTEEGLDLRAAKDIDLVLIIEAVDPNFGKKFWEYVKQAGYEHCNKSSGVPQFYRFSHPITNQYPAMIELFTRKLDAIQLPVRKAGWLNSNGVVKHTAACEKSYISGVIRKSTEKPYFQKVLPGAVSA